jgi:spore coat polysaccharide biosynthesis predicted glycosyltransferase SpsG/RimJ/RimL family protein N-acetyltransferase
MDSAGDATIVPPATASSWVDRYRAEGVAVAGAPDGFQDADWVVLDGYGYGRAEQEAAVAAGARLLVVDDHGAVGSYERADVVLDQNLGASEEDYRSRRPSTDLLLGPRFALLRQEFRRRVTPEERPRREARQVLVTLGGSPPDAAVALVEAALAQVGGDGLRAVWLSGADTEVASAMAEADVAVSAAGSTCWELCRMGLPAVLIPIAANQVPLAGALAHAGAAVDAGPFEHLTPGSLALRIAALAGDAAQREAMSEQGRRLVDGRGAVRVVGRLRAELLSLRHIEADDCRLLWEWANDPTVRAAAFSTAAIGWDEHRSWISASLADPSRHMYLALDPGGVPMGQVRFDEHGMEAIVSVSIAATHRGKGWGAALIDAGVRRLFRDSAVDFVRARIKPENVGSLRAFDAAAFCAEDMQTDGNGTWCQYARRRQPLAHCDATGSAGSREAR